MVSERTVLIVTCIAAAFVVILLGMLAVYPHVASTWMFEGTRDALQAMSNQMTAMNNYIIQLLW